jgi:DNA-binding transcriptional MerR regulator/methylmalonyl-CoA mutase cobalamin-binding subunit
MPTHSRELRHPIKVVCHRTGLTAHAIRVWERRYGLICCQRTDSNRRLYSDEEIERLRLLKTLTDCGHRISNIARLDLEELYALHKQDHPAPATSEDYSPAAHTTPDQCLLGCLEAANQLDAPALTQLLEDARLQYGQRSTLLRVIAPLIFEIGERWRKGEMRVAHEHLATNVLRDYLSSTLRSCPPAQAAPELVVCTPAGQAHEVGALLAAAAARDLGWRVTYLGPSLPAEEIAACAHTRKARAVALSMVYPSDDPQVPQELTHLRRILPAHISIIIGGRAAYGYHQALRIPDVRLVNDLADLEAALDESIAHKPHE